ncbi:hypothetical protein ACFPYM_08615, partial [Methylobacterium hispanicum]
MTEAPAPKICTLIGSNKGGIGKSFIATLYISAHGQVRQSMQKVGEQMDPLVVIEIDNEAKLHATMKERVNFSLRAAPDLSSISRDRRAMERYFNPVFQWWCVGDSLTDLGANVTTPVLDWMRTTAVPELAAERNIHFRFLAVAIPDAQSLRSARQAVETVMDTLGNRVTPVLVFNDMWGIDHASGFTPYQDNPDLLELETYRREGRMLRVDVPFCDSQLMEYGRAHNLSVLDVWQREAHIARELGLDDLSQRTEKHRLLKWLCEVQHGFGPLFARPAAPAEPVPA